MHMDYELLQGLVESLEDREARLLRRFSNIIIIDL